jgi:uncharacterized protein (TIGR03083 family)
VLRAARAARPPEVERHPAVTAYEVETAAPAELLDSLHPSDWSAPTGGRDLDVHGLVAHLLGGELTFAASQDINDFVPAAVHPNHRRMTETVIVAERSRRPAQIVATRRAVTTDTARYTLKAEAADLDTGPAGGGISLSIWLLGRTFKTRIHADDIRAAIARSLDSAAMGRPRPGVTAAIKLTGAHGGSFLILFAPGGGSAAPALSGGRAWAAPRARAGFASGWPSGGVGVG